MILKTWQFESEVSDYMCSAVKVQDWSAFPLAIMHRNTMPHDLSAAPGFIYVNIFRMFGEMFENRTGKNRQACKVRYTDADDSCDTNGAG